MPDLEYKITVKDDGSAVVDRFEKKTEDSMDDAADATDKASKRMRRSFKAVGAASARVRGSFSNVVKSATTLKNLFLTGLGAAIVVKGLRSITAAAAQQEDAVARLNAALRTAGMFSEETSQRMQDLASSLQAQTRFGDETIIAMQTLLVTYGVTSDKLEEATKVTLDFAAATGTELNTAALLVGKAASGMTSSLSRYGIVLDKGIPENEKFSAALAKMNQQFGGRAQADVNTWSGVVAQTRNIFGDFLEALGDGVIKSKKLRESLVDMSIGFRVLSGDINASKETRFGDFLADLVPTAETVVVIFGIVNRTFHILAASFKTAALAILAVVGIGGVLTDKLRITKGAADRLARTVKDLSASVGENGLAIEESARQQIRAKSTIAALRAEHKKRKKALEEETKATEKNTAAQKKNNEVKERAAVTVATLVLSSTERVIKGRLESLRILQRLSAVEAEHATELKINFLRAATTFEEFSAIQQKAVADAIASIDPKQVVKRGEAFIRAVRDIGQKIPSAEIQQQIRLAFDVPGIEFALPELITPEAQAQLAEQIEAIRPLFFELSQEAQFRILEVVAASRAGAEEQLAILEDLTSREIALEVSKRQTLVSGTASLFGALAALAETGGEKAFGISKAFAVAEATVRGIQAVQSALASPPGPPFTFPLAAAVAVQTALNIRKILATQPGGAAAPAAAAGGGGGAAPAAAEAPPAPVPEAAPVAAGPQVSITVQGFIGNEAELATELDGLMREARGDGLEFGMGT